MGEFYAYNSEDLSDDEVEFGSPTFAFGRRSVLRESRRSALSESAVGDGYTALTPRPPSPGVLREPSDFVASNFVASDFVASDFVASETPGLTDAQTLINTLKEKITKLELEKKGTRKLLLSILRIHEGTNLLIKEILTTSTLRESTSSAKGKGDGTQLNIK